MDFICKADFSLEIDRSRNTFLHSYYCDGWDVYIDDGREGRALMSIQKKSIEENWNSTTK